MVSSNIDVGQLLIAGLIGVVGWFVNRTISRFERRLDNHDKIILRLLNYYTALTGKTIDFDGELL